MDVCADRESGKADESMVVGRECASGGTVGAGRDSADVLVGDKDSCSVGGGSESGTTVHATDESVCEGVEGSVAGKDHAVAVGGRKSGGSPQMRRFTFTINMEPEEVEEVLFETAVQLSCAVADQEISRAIFQHEKAPLTGEDHLQGYAATTNRSFRLGGVKRLLQCDWAHIEKAMGSDDEAWSYCTKGYTAQGEPYVFGKPLCKSGHRSSMEEIADRLMTGSPVEDISQDYPVEYMRYSRGIRDLSATMEVGRGDEDPVRVVLLWGMTRSGKTYDAGEICKRFGYDVYTKDAGTKWWDRYHGQEAVVINEYCGDNRGDGITWSSLLNVCDRGPCIVQTKFGSAQMKAKLVVITTNQEYVEWPFKSRPHQYQSIGRTQVELEDDPFLERVRENGVVVHYETKFRNSGRDLKELHPQVVAWLQTLGL